MTFQVATANSVEFSAIQPYVFNDNWFFEQKLDGERLAIRVHKGAVGGVNRRGVATPVHRSIIQALSGTTGAWIFDGEWIGDTFWAFDLAEAPGLQFRAPYALRRASLDAIVPVLTERTPMIQLVPTHRTPEEKVALARWVVEHNAEGLMLKDGRCPYAGKRSDAMLKAKLVETVDCIVSEVGREGKHSVAVAVLDGDGMAFDVGSVKVTDALLRTLKVGDVIEVEYLYFTEGDRLYQAQFSKVRPDKTAAECTADQLKHTDKSVLATRLP